VRDLITVEQQLGFSYETDRPGLAHYQQVCPKCRRALFGLAQGRLWRAARAERSLADGSGPGAS
jgi:hypothetical protein